MSLAKRLFLGSLLLLLVMVALVVALADRRLGRRLIDETVATLTREARAIAAEWRPAVDSDSLADAIGRILARRVTLIDPAGRVVGDTDFDPPQLQDLQNHRARPEVVEAIRVGAGWSRRTSPSNGDEELYVAVRASQGVVRISMSTRTAT